MSLPGFTFNITGASGATGLLGPKNSYRCYVFPRGGYAAQDSTGSKITFDSASVASRFAVGNWIQSGLLTTNIRQVGAVGGNSLTVSGAALTVTTNDRIYLIGNTEPTISGGSATYTTPATIVRQRDDDAATLYTNSMLTTNTDGMVQGFAVTALYDLLIQDGNRANQGSLIDLPVGVPEGISVSDAAIFGATVTISTNLVVGSSITADNIGGIRYSSGFASLQAAINDLPSTGGTVYITPGDYTENIVSTKEGVQLVGLGTPVTNILAQARLVRIQATSGTVLDIGSSSSATHNGWHIENVLIRDSAGAACNYGLRVRRMTHCTFNNVGFENFGAANSAALYLDGTGGSNGAVGYTLLSGCGIRQNASGVSSSIGIKLTKCSATTLIGGQMAGAVSASPVGKGIEGDSASDSLRVMNTSMEDWGTAIELDGSHNHIHARIEGQNNNGTGVALLSNGQDNFVSGSMTGLLVGVTITAGNNNNTICPTYSNVTTPYTDGGEANLFVSGSRTPQIIHNATGAGQQWTTFKTGVTTVFAIESGTAGAVLDATTGVSNGVLIVRLTGNTFGSYFAVRDQLNANLMRMYGDGTLEVAGVSGHIALTDGIVAPGTVAGQALIYVDIADGDLKCKFGDGFVRVIGADS